MGVGLLTLLAKSRVAGVAVDSAGVRADLGARAADEAILVMGELGIDISSHRSKPVTSDLLVWADYVVVVEKTVGEELKEQFGEVDRKVCALESDVSDPFPGSAAEYRRTRDQLHELFLRWSEAFLFQIPSDRRP
jgi:protein-tyrosine-phosphatase